MLLAVAACGSGASGAGASSAICAGQCAPPYQLRVTFTAGTSQATAEKVMSSCAEDNPAVIRAGTPHYLPNGMSRAIIYTRVFAGAKRTSQLQECLRSSGVVATAAWPS